MQLISLERIIRLIGQCSRSNLLYQHNLFTTTSIVWGGHMHDDKDFCLEFNKIPVAFSNESNPLFRFWIEPLERHPLCEWEMSPPHEWCFCWRQQSSHYRRIELLALPKIHWPIRQTTEFPSLRRRRSSTKNAVWGTDWERQITKTENTHFVSHTNGVIIF